MDWKKIGKKLLFPNVLIILLLTIISAALLVYVFVNGLETAAIAYVSYLISFYGLTVLVIYLCMVLPKQYRNIKQKVYDNPWGNRYMTNAAFRTKISLHMSLAIHLLYVGMNVVLAFMNKTRWFGILAGYYLILAVMQFLLLKYAIQKGIGTERQGELRRARVCAIILLNLNFVLSGAVLMILYQNKGFKYQGILIYAMAAYTFYSTIRAVVDLIRYRKYKSPIMTTTKIITLSSALVSMLSLETAMFFQFGQDMNPASRRLMIALTGAGISMAVIGMSAYMIIKTSQELENTGE
ncbi:MAG: hypothetical protein IKL49_00770 [Lachnospiraceae bacterium]|nr:hypothetical protein [Lachnospiraceae bacterium]